MIKALSQTTAIARMLAIPAIRDPATYGFVFLFPVIFLFLFWLIGGMRLGQHVLFGSLISLMMNSGIISLPQTVVAYKFKKLQDMYVASPVHQLTYLFGLGLSRLLYSAPGVILFFIILLASRYMPLGAVPVVVLVLLMSWATGCAIGFTIATYFNNIMQVSAAANLLGLFMLLMPPVMYPLELIPEHWRWLALVIPSTSAAQLIKVACGASSLNSPANRLAYWAILIFYTVACFVLVLKKSRWREV
jgi:ABC-2 type transport system permease protein